MAYALTNTTGFSFAAKLHEVTEAWKLDRARRTLFNQTFGELNALSDRELSDIGLGRSDIRDVSWNHAVKSA